KRRLETMARIEDAIAQVKQAQQECEKHYVEEESQRRTVAQARHEEGAAWAGVIESYTSARAQVVAAEDRALETARKVFPAGCRALFEAHLELQSFGWKQFTKDSDCGEFSSDYVDCDVPDINGTEGYSVDGRYGWGFESGNWRGKGEPSLEAKLQRAVCV